VPQSMADPSVDMAALSPEQQLALQQYTAVTDQPAATAIPQLARCQWNVQIAIARFFDGEPAGDPIAAAPQDVRRQETLLNGFSSPRSSSSSLSSSNRARSVRIEPAPRVVPQPDGQVGTQVPLVLAVVFAPFSLAYSLATKWFRFLGWLFPFLPRTWGRVTASSITTPAARRSASARRPLSPRDTAARFLREFDEEYGPHTLPFFEGGYAQAFDLAKKNLHFLLVVLISPENDATSSFVRDTLLAPDVVAFVRDPANNIILWAGNVADSEAYQVASALTCTKFPFTGLIVHTPQVSSTAMGIAGRIAGPTTPSHYIAKLRAAMRQHVEPLARVRTQRAEQDATRSIRQQQDTAYQRSLATDRERARKKQQEADRLAREQQAAHEKQTAQEHHRRQLAQWRTWRASLLAPEPSPDDKNAVRISLRMPDAQRVVRRFPHDASLEDLYAFVDCFSLLTSSSSSSSSCTVSPSSSSSSSSSSPPFSSSSSPSSTTTTKTITSPVTKPIDFSHTYSFRLCSPMPREVFPVDDGRATLLRHVGRSGNLIVEEEGDDDDDDADDDEKCGRRTKVPA